MKLNESSKPNCLVVFLFAIEVSSRGDISVCVCFNRVALAKSQFISFILFYFTHIYFVLLNLLFRI